MSEVAAEEMIRVQIVEDERIVAQELKLSLESMGFCVVGMAGSEQQAVELAESGRPDVVLMDINLGRGGDGTRAAAAIRQRFQVPVIYLTAYAGSDVLQKADVTAPYGYVLKPFEMRELNATIRMALARRREERRAEAAERRLRLALEAAKLTVIEVDRDERKVSFDGSLKSLHAGDAMSFSLDLQSFLARLEDGGVRANAEQALLSGTALDLRAAWKNSQGNRVWLDIHACYFERDRKVIGILSDVTAQVHSEEKLRQASVVFEAAGDAILILDQDQRVCMANGSFSRYTGWSLQDVIGRRPGDFLHAMNVGNRRRQGDLELDRAPRTEVACLRSDGSLFPAWENIAPVLDREGRITNYVVSFCDISILRETQNRLSHLAMHDALTGLGNRHHLDICLRQKISGALANGASEKFALLFIDLDGFKHVNDTLGHAVGDELLVEIAQRLRRDLRQDDMAVRLGGDEFLVIVNGGLNDEEAAGLTGKLLHLITQPIHTQAGQVLRLTASIGIAVFPDHADSADDLIKAADTALYEAKRTGRNRFVRFDRTLSTQTLERMRLEQGLRDAVANRGFQLHWQPIMDMRTSTVVAAEALLRWNFPGYGAVSPERFIPVAEETGLIIPIGEWVVWEACRQLAAWRREGISVPRVALNVSVAQLQRPGYMGAVKHALAMWSIAPEAIEIEVTESSLQTGETVREALRDLRDLGLSIALDDFGTGFSSLAMLKHLPLNRLKIDKAFVREIATDGNDQAIARAIAAMGTALGLALTAEGVETEAQRDYLRDLGVGEAQGWYFYRAMDAASFAAAIRSTRVLSRGRS